jgi:serine/threonine-protein kinase
MLGLKSLLSFLVLSLATFVSLACASTNAAAQNYGAIAFSQSSGAVGFSYNFRRRDIAEERALEECGGGCRVVTWFRNACGALATGNGNGYGSGWASSRGSAERIALNKCAANTRNCRVIRWACTAR